MWRASVAAEVLGRGLMCMADLTLCSSSLEQMVTGAGHPSSRACAWRSVNLVCAVSPAFVAALPEVASGRPPPWL